MYPENLVAPVESVLPMDLVYTCPALVSPLLGNLIWCDWISSNWNTTMPLEVRRGQVLRNCCIYWVGPVANSGLLPFYRFFLGASLSPLIWHWSFLVSHLFQMVSPHYGGYFPSPSRWVPSRRLHTCSWRCRHLLYLKDIYLAGLTLGPQDIWVNSWLDTSWCRHSLVRSLSPSQASWKVSLVPWVNSRIAFRTEVVFPTE